MKVLNQPIEVVAEFTRATKDTKEDVKPLRFRITDENCEQRVIQIDKVMKKDKLKIAGHMIMSFTCMVTINGVQKPCEVRYDMMGMNWVLWKM